MQYRSSLDYAPNYTVHCTVPYSKLSWKNGKRNTSITYNHAAGSNKTLVIKIMENACDEHVSIDPEST